MRVASFGDCLTSGIYSVYSRFRKSAHFVNGQNLISLVDPAIGNGPNHIVVEGLNVGEVDTIEITDRTIQIDGTVCARKKGREYSSRLTTLALNAWELQHNIRQFEKCVYENASENSFPNLMRNNMWKLQHSQLNIVLAEQLASGWQALKRGALETGVGLLIGAGYGLTPSGDDFVAGYCSGLYLGGARFAGLRRRLVKTIDRASEATNMLSRTMLRHCSRGRFYERAKLLLVALNSGNTSEIGDSASAMCAVGETSGTDFSFGLLCALQDGIA